MRFVSTKIHGAIDYLTGLALILAPFVLGFDTGGAAMWVPIVIGAGILLQSLFTNYELGLFRKISMPAHLGVDVIAGALLAVSPWLFGFDEIVWLPHLIVGLFEVALGLVTHKVPDEVPPRTRHVDREATI